ncbi:hypothetical protein MHK03_05985 [Corynebacterium simulans]|uniref:hypothetical protein n=1 Tax=Corynebacterium simulans TaxID=146827 RepID=UPI001EF1EA72|nr:hypothetical protein [Corynebacterium simulans]MCG7247474.1 hypothetical protein [Corynebacterium simulans]
MSNIDKAAQAIDTWAQDNTLTADTGNPHNLAQDLADAGLLKTEFEESELSRLFGLETAVERAIRKGWVDEREFEDFL